MSSNVCFNFFTDPDIVSDDTSNESICDYDVYIIFAECFGKDELTPKIDDAEKAVYKIVSNVKYSDNDAALVIAMTLDDIYLNEGPVVDVIIKKRKFLGEDF